MTNQQALNGFKNSGMNQNQHLRESEVKEEDEELNIDQILEKELQQEGTESIPVRDLFQKILQMESIYEQHPQYKQSAGRKEYPQFDDLKKCLAQVSEKYQEKAHLENSLQFLHTLVHSSCPYGEVQEEQRPQRQERHEQVSRQMIPKQNFMRKNSGKSEEEIMVAESFIRHGYGLRVLRQEIKDPSLTPTRYNNIITLVMKATFRAIEASIGKANKIRTVSHNEEKILRSPMINCSKWLPKDESETFNKFVMIAYGFGNAPISAQAAIKLYRSLMTQLSKRERQESLQTNKNYSMKQKKRIYRKRKFLK